jgi:probable phosphoglycerate mutase
MKKWLTAIIMFASAATCSAAEMKDDGSINIYFARHGKTLLNTFDRVQGWADSPLTEDGIRVARYLGEGLKEVKFDRFYSSDAGRQRETMAVILKQAGINDYRLIELPGLREAFLAALKAASTRIWQRPAHNSWA